MDWKAYWDERARRYPDDDFCRQVGRTSAGGEVTPDDELERAVQQVVEAVGLQPWHRALDLCCGNGLLSMRLARGCREVVGVDFSQPMIEIAQRFHHPVNVKYVPLSVLDLAPGTLPPGPPFDRIVMFESLHYFLPEQLGRLLSGMLAVAAPGTRVCFSGIPDRERIWFFYDTPERRATYEQQKREGRDVMGHWWRREEILAATEPLGLEAEFRAQDPSLNTAHYRFDLVLSVPGQRA